MQNYNFNEQYNKYLNLFNTALENLFNSLNITDAKLKQSMYYTISAGGKRIRPVMCLATADMLNVSLNKIMPFALALECIHTYSLIHDDLPCMDNDDYRRGKLSNHKAFGEGVATIAGDGLLNLAIEICSNNLTDSGEINALKYLFKCSGALGMVGGQALDLNNENNIVNENLYNEIIDKKTSCLIKASLVMPSCLANGKHQKQLELFGEYFGKIFQITDDILDQTSTLITLGKTPNKDKQQNKLSAIKMYGLDGARKKVSELLAKCQSILSDINGSEFLKTLLETTVNRQN